MESAKSLHIAPIRAADANRLIQRLHYSGKTVQNSQLHFGVFYKDRLEGAMQFGPSLDKRKMLALVQGTGWNDFIELNRMAFSDVLPRNAESRAIGIAFRLIKRHYSNIQWCVSFADGTQCGDGTIYRASGFVLTAINKSLNLVRLPSGNVIHKMTLESNPCAARPELGGLSYYQVTNGKYDLSAYARRVGGAVIPGFQLRYLYFLDNSARQRLTVPVLPFSAIDEVGARMYRGQRVTSADSGMAAIHAAGGGANPTVMLSDTNI